MKNTLLRYLLIILIPLSFWGGFKCGQGKDEYFMPPPQRKVMEMVSDDQKDTCYLISEVWGVGQDHYQTVITKKRPPDDNLLWKPNSAEDFIWNGTSSGIFYKRIKDTVHFLSPAPPSRPKVFHSQLVFICDTIDNLTFISLQQRVDTSLKLFKL